MYLLLFNATPAPSPAIELLSDSHSWGMLLRAHSMSPCSLGIPGRRDPPHTPRRRDLCPGTHSDRKSPLSSSTCHAVPHREQQTPNSHHPWGLPSLSPSAPRAPPAGAKVCHPPPLRSAPDLPSSPALSPGARVPSQPHSRIGVCCLLPALLPCLQPHAEPAPHLSAPSEFLSKLLLS